MRNKVTNPTLVEKKFEGNPFLAAILPARDQRSEGAKNRGRKSEVYKTLSDRSM